MKTTKSNHLGGANDKGLEAHTFEEVAEMSKKRANAPSQMQELMHSLDAMNEWFENKGK